MSTYSEPSEFNPKLLPTSPVQVQVWERALTQVAVAVAETVRQVTDAEAAGRNWRRVRKGYSDRREMVEDILKVEGDEELEVTLTGHQKCHGKEI